MNSLTYMDNLTFINDLPNSFDIIYLSLPTINRDITSFINYYNLSIIFLSGLFTSLFFLSFCKSTKKKRYRYIIINQNPPITETHSIS